MFSTSLAGSTLLSSAKEIRFKGIQRQPLEDTIYVKKSL